MRKSHISGTRIAPVRENQVHSSVFRDPHLVWYKLQVLARNSPIKNFRLKSIFVWHNLCLKLGPRIRNNQHYQTLINLAKRLKENYSQMRQKGEKRGQSSAKHELRVGGERGVRSTRCNHYSRFILLDNHSGPTSPFYACRSDYHLP